MISWKHVEDRREEVPSVLLPLRRKVVEKLVLQMYCREQWGISWGPVYARRRGRSTLHKTFKRKQEAQ